MANLFHAHIDGWPSWAKVYQDREAFGPLALSLLRRHGLPAEPLTPLTPGTHFVARSGDNVIKIYAPRESGIGGDESLWEIAGLRHAARVGVPVPALLAEGSVQDRYAFKYLIQRYLSGEPFATAGKRHSRADKVAFGQALRALTARLQVPMDGLPPRDLIAQALDNPRWRDWPASFLREQEAALRGLPPQDPVFVHGDINEDNLLISGDELTLIDFGDCCLAPAIYEEVVIAIELFRLDRDYLRGYFGDFDSEALAENCVRGLLLHDFGAGIASQRLGLERCRGVNELRQGIRRRLRG